MFPCIAEGHTTRLKTIIYRENTTKILFNLRNCNKVFDNYSSTTSNMETPLILELTLYYHFIVLHHTVPTKEDNVVMVRRN